MHRQDEVIAMATLKRIASLLEAIDEKLGRLVEQGERGPTPTRR